MESQINQVQSKNTLFIMQNLPKLNSFENDPCKIRSISRQSLEQISQILDKSRPMHDHINICGNFKAITQLIQAIIQGRIPPQYQVILPKQTLQHLLNQFSYSAIFYALLLKINHYNYNQVNFHNEKHKYFITQQLTQPNVVLEAFVQILEEERIQDKELVLRLLGRVKQRLQKSMGQLESDAKTVEITHYDANGASKYFYQFQVGRTQKGGYQAGTPIISANTLSHRSKVQFYQQIFKQTEKHFASPEIATKIVEEIILSIGIITYLKTIKLSKEKTMHKGNKNQFPMQMTGYKEIANVTNYQVQLSYAKSSLEQGCTLKLTISLPEKLSLINKPEFYQNQKFTSVLKERKIISTSICVENLVYQINASKKIGKGSFGSVYQCQSFQLHHCKAEGSQLKYFLKRKNVAAKEIALEQGELQQHYIPLNRQHLIISLIKELSHREMIKRTKRSLGVQVEGDVPGINRIVPLVQYFKRSSTKASNQTYLIMFQLGSHTLSSKQFLDSFVKGDNYDEKLYDLFYKIFEGLNFLHYQINKYYPNQLRRYFIAQKEQKKNKEKDNISQFVQSGKNGILHRDIKPSNIIINYNSSDQIDQLFIIDFGMAKITDFSKKGQHTNCGSAYYMAPEIRNGKIYDEKVDIWSTGVFMYEMYARNAGKLYSSIHSHSMNEVNREISTYIDRIADNNKCWKNLLSMMLNKEGEERKQADEILRFLIDQEIQLKGNKAQLCKLFKGCIKYIYTQKFQDSKKTIRIQPCNQQYNLQEMMAQAGKNHFKQIKISKFMSSNIHLPSQHHKYALASLFHLIHSKKIGNAEQLLAEMSQLEILATCFEGGNEAKYLLIIKEGSSHKHISSQQMQQTMMVTSIQEEQQIKTSNNFVLALTNTTIRAMEKTHEQSPSNIFYCNGIIIGEKPLREHLLAINQDYSSHIKASQYLDGQTLFINKNISNTRSNLMILKDSKLSPSYIAETIFQLLTNQQNKHSQIILNPSSEEFIANQNVSHIMSLYRNEETLRVSFNGHQINKLMQFSWKMKQMAAKLLKMDATICYQYKFVLSLYLACKDHLKFNKMLEDLSFIIKDPLKPQIMIKQFSADFHYLLQHPSLLRTQKMLIKSIITSINHLTNLLSKHFYPNTDTFEQTNISYPIFSRHIEQLSDNLQQIPQFLSSDKEKDRLKAIATLGQRILLIFESLKSFFKLWLAEETK